MAAPPAAPQDLTVPDRIARDAEEAREAVDRAQIDVEALLEQQDYAASDLVRFVHQQIAFEPYAGVLRGARGTLLSRAGNAFDQALLLATLLRDAGFEARIQRARLSEAQARQLLQRAGAHRQPAPDPGDIDKLRTLLGPPDGGTADPPQPGWIESESQIEQAVTMLQGELEAADLRLRDPESLRTLVEETLDYAWVEWRAAAASPWKSVHPAYMEGQGPGPLTPIETWTREVPAEWQHRLRVGVFIEQKLGDRLLVHRVVPDWERPVANLAGQSFTIGNYPGGMPEDLSEFDPDAVLADTTFFLPLFAGSVLPGTRAFDRDGVPHDVELDGMGATGVLRTVGGKTEQAAAALGALGRASATPAAELRTLTAQWVDYTLVAPGGRVTTARRYLLDRLGPAARAARDWTPLERPLEPGSLIATQEFAVATGRIPDALVLDESIRLLGALARFAAAAGAGSGEPGKLPTGEPVEALRTALPFLELFQRFDRPLSPQGHVIEYRPEPTVVVFHTSLTSEGKVQFNADVVHHATRALRVSEADVAAAPEAVLKPELALIAGARRSVALGCRPSSRFDRGDSFNRVAARGYQPAAWAAGGPRPVWAGLVPAGGYYARGGWGMPVSAEPRATTAPWVPANDSEAATSEYQPATERGVIGWTVGVTAVVMVLSLPNAVECAKAAKGQLAHTGRMANPVCCLIGKQAGSLSELLQNRWMWAHYKLRQLEGWGARDCQ